MKHKTATGLRATKAPKSPSRLFTSLSTEPSATLYACHPDVSEIELPRFRRMPYDAADSHEASATGVTDACVPCCDPCKAPLWTELTKEAAKDADERTGNDIGST